MGSSGRHGAEGRLSRSSERCRQPLLPGGSHDPPARSHRRIAAAATENFEDEDGNPAVLVGAGNKRVSNIRFYPASVNIRVGQTITFLKTHDPTEPHTVTFGPEPSDMLQQLIPRGGSTYAGGKDEQANSGLLVTRQQFDYYQLAPLAAFGLPVALTKYRLTFTKAGDFKYICAIHDGAGMVAWVHVR